MIQSVQIQNFKSVVDLTLELGTFNVLIGANGCGKSNILEAIAFGAAASADKLDHEFLGNRGIRITNPEFMFSAFGGKKKKKVIEFIFFNEKKTFSYKIKTDPSNSRLWIDEIKNRISDFDAKGRIKSLQKEIGSLEDIEDSYVSIQSNSKDEIVGKEDIERVTRLKNDLKNIIVELDKLHRETKSFLASSHIISNYILYAPEQTSLRKFEDTNQIYPLGIKGEGLFQYLKELSQDEKNAEVLNEIKECLLLLDWYEDFKLPQNLMSNEFTLSIKDKYLNENLQFFDQRSTNEGFLFLLFYATLFTSKDTPQFFAIDNIDASFNPKLCMQVTKTLAELAKKHGKQVIVTTQNPAILDGLDLTDNSQRLFVVRRNEEGHTKAKRIEHKAERTMKLSEVWTNGFIGGLPDNF